VLAHYGGDITRVNIEPRRRAKILRRYATTEPGQAAA
jgi:alkane 1-monooxygenase